ncbi:MAG: Ig-like domain-containing protein, partial [Pseudohongiella sp.]|nr:Ig-like domain-containing protein [Pseudohongiella sp.]
MSEQIRKILQKAFILGTGRGATAIELEWAEGLVSPEVSYIKVVHTVNEYMDGLAREQGIVPVVQSIVKNAQGIILSDAETHQLIADMAAIGIDTWDKFFEYSAFRQDALGTTLDNRAEASGQFLDALDAAGKSDFFTGPAVNLAMTTLLQNISSSAASLENGIAGLDALSDNLTATGITGTVFGVGYITGATVFTDTNRDGELSPGEWSTTTDGDGKFELPNSNVDGKIIAFNGTGLMTGNQFRSVFSSITGTTVINTFTTLIEAMMTNGEARTVAEATTALRSALGLPDDINLLSYDPLAILASSTTTAEEKTLALSVQANAQQITNILTQIAAIIAATTDDQILILNAAKAVVSALDSAITNAAHQSVTLDLTNTAVLSNITQTVVAETGSTLTVQQADQIALVTAGSNISAGASINITELSQSVTVSLGDATTALIAGAAAGNFDGAVAGFTGESLAAANLAATVGYIDAVVPVPPPASPTDTTAPSAQVQVTSLGSDAAGNFLVTVTFNEPVFGFSNSNLSAANGTLTAVSSADGGTTWTSTLTPTSNTSDTSNVVTLTSTGITDAAGNAATGTVTSNNYSINNVGPSSALVVLETTLKAGETTDVTNTFNKVVTGLTIADMIVENGTLTNILSIDGGLTWTATFTPNADITDATNVITLDNTRIADLSGNRGTGTTLSNNYAIDTLRPTASIVVDDAVLTAGETSDVTITFNEVVTGFTNADLSIENATLSGVTSVDGMTWTATLTPTANIADTTNIITLTNSGVADSAGNAGTGTTLSNNYVIDTQQPTATIVFTDTALQSGETSAVTITFSEAVTGFSNADLIIENGTLSNVSSVDNITWSATFTPTANITDSTNVVTLTNSGFIDATGNTGTGTTLSDNYAIDTVRPFASIVMADTALKTGETSAVTITFNEAVSGFNNADLSVENGILSNVASIDNIIWTATFTPTANLTDTTNVITLTNTGIADLAGNTGTGTTASKNYAIDTTQPTASILVADTALKLGETSPVTITFSEKVTGFTNEDLNIANGTLTNVTSADGGMTWNATLTPTLGINDTSNVITLANTGLTDVAGNAGIGTTLSNNYAVDTLRPTASIVVADTALKTGETSVVTFTFTEAVSNFTNADLSIANATLSAVSSLDGGITWTATLTPTADTTDTSNLITLANTGITDLAGNAGIGTTNSNNYAIDTLRPTATIVLSDTALMAGKSADVTITFNEAVTGFTNADLTIDNGTLSSVATVDNITWTAIFTPTVDMTDVTNVITLDNTGVMDLSGNVGVGTSGSKSYAVDTLRPTASIVVADTALKVGETSVVTITFNETITGFTNADLAIENGTLSNVVSADNIIWTATFTPTADLSDTINVITLTNSGVSDTAGNAGIGTTRSNNYQIDTLRPTATIVVTQTALKIGETSGVTITFDDAVTGFTNADLTIANGTLTDVVSLDDGVIWTATFTPTANLTDTTNVIMLANTGVADLAGNAGTGTTNSNNYAIDTLQPTATIVVADTALKHGETSDVTITFNEVVNGFTNADLTFENGTLSNVASINNITWTAVFTPTADITDTTNVISLANTGVTDAAGNAGAGSTNSNNFAIDTRLPTATIVVANADIKAGETSLVTITFNEAVSGFNNADLSIANGTLSDVGTLDGGITWTATFTPSVDTHNLTNVIVLTNNGVIDAAGNAGTGTTSSNNYEIDTLRPTATIVVADTALSAGETSSVSITFNEAVTGFTNADLTIANGTLTKVSTLDGGITWTATLTPATATLDTTNVITLANTGVSDLSGNAGTGTTSSNNYAIDTQRPTATIVVADTAMNAGETSAVTITFNEAISGFTNADLSIANGTLTNVSTLDAGITWTATFTPTVGINDTTNVITLANTGVTDAAGNAGVGTTISNNYAIDTLRPSASIVVADTALKAGETSAVTITFNEAVSGFTNADLTIVNGTLSNVASVDNINWTATFTPTADLTDTTNVITLANTGVTDAAGNAGSGTTNSNNYAIDTLRPTASIVVADTAMNAGETSAVTITFNEAVSGFTNADLSIANGTLTNVSTLNAGITWTATFTPTVGISDTTNVITLANTGVTDVAGNAGTGTTSSNNYAIDTLRPTANIVVADTALKAGETSAVTFTFNEAVSGFTNADLTIANGTLTDVATGDGGITWTATLTPTADLNDTTNIITLTNTGVADAAGNAGTGTTSSNNYAIDTLRPTASIVVADTALQAGETSAVTITFNEAVSGFTNADLTIENGTLSNVVTVDNINWTATFTPSADITDTTNVIILANTGVTDVAGNAGTGTTSSNNYAIDTLLPTASIVVADTALKAGETSAVTFTFNEAVSGFTNADLSIANGTLSNVASIDNINWTATFTPTADLTDSTNVITLANIGVTDVAGNAGTGTTNSNNYAIDTLRPTAVIVVADTALKAGETTAVTITFNEAVTGFTNIDLSIANGTLTDVVSADNGITWTATLTPTADISDSSNVITLANTGISDAAGNTGTGTTSSNNYVIDTLRPTASIVVADTALGAGETSAVTITFDGAVTGFSNADLSIANGKLTDVATVDGGITWTATLTPTA